MIFSAGFTTPSITVEVFDDAGLPVTGLIAATFPSLYWNSEGANADNAFPALSDLATITTAYVAGGVKERSVAGKYRLDLPTGVVATAGMRSRVFGEATNKRVVAPVIDVSPPVDLRLWKGSTPNDLIQGRLDVLQQCAKGQIQSVSGLTTTLDAAGSASNNTYRYSWVLMLTGAGAGECIQIGSYLGSTKAATMVANWVNNPSAGDWYVILPASYVALNWAAIAGSTNGVNLSGTNINAVTYVSYPNYTGSSYVVTGSTTNTVTASAAGFGTNNRFRGSKVTFLSGTATQQTRVIKSHTNTEITIEGAWNTNPAIGDTFALMRDDLPVVNASRSVQADLREILGSALTETVSGYLAAGFKKLYDVVSPIFTLASANQTGDAYGVVNDSSSGNPALAALITNIKNNTFVRSTIPEVLERPDAGSKTIQIVFTYEDENGNAKNLDAGNPTISLTDDDANDLSGRLGSWTNPTTGKYVINYMSSAADEIEGLHWDVTGTVNAKVRRYVAYMQVVDTTAVDFTSSDRTKLDSILTHATAADSQSVASAIRAAVGLAAANLDTQIAGIGASVWSVLTSAVSTAGSFGLALKDFLASYTASPTVSEIADTLFEDGTTNKLKVNSDHSASVTVIGDVPIDISGIPPISIVVPAAIAVASQDPAVVTCLRGDTLRVSLPLLGNITDRTKLTMTAKSHVNDVDDQAVLQVVEMTGLVRLNGAAPIASNAASLTVQDAMTGAVDLEIDATATAALAIQDLVWDVQMISSSTISSPVSGTMSVVADVTRAIN